MSGFGGPTAAAESLLRFRVHRLNPDSQFSAAAAIDVDGDGDTDIVAGQWWYEAPSWKRHFLREVTQIRGRYDDYSCLPLDVNGDGQLDLLSVNYRSQSLYWVEHPGKQLAATTGWKTHVIATPGPMETGRLADVDGDGQLDVLPNGVRDAFWFRLDRTAPNQPRWVKHPLPPAAAGHGIGFGDLNGDGRGDLVTPRGWFEAPDDRRSGRWGHRAEFRLHRDAGIPILVTDVDRDGDNDIIWSRGHNIGLYWLRQEQPGAPPGEKRGGQTGEPRGGERQWTFLPIDTSLSTTHSLLLADLDGDGQQELVAGKRYLGHDGRDPGEWEPLAIFYYKYQPQSQTWVRGVVAPPGTAGFDLDPKAADLDGDGDLDLLAPTRNGLCWIENLGPAPQPATPTTPTTPTPTTQWEPSPEPHDQLLVVASQPQPAGQGPSRPAPQSAPRTTAQRPVISPADWAWRRLHIQRNMEVVMGPFPPPSRRVPLEVRVHDSERTEKYVRQRISFQAEAGDRVPAYLLLPHAEVPPPAPQAGGRPAMLCLHQTTGIGKGEPAGLGGQPNLHYAHELAQRGYVCVVPDYPSFGDYAFAFENVADRYASGSMKAIWNNVRAVDLLEGLPEVNPDRIGCIGHSLGGHNSLFTAVFDRRLKAVASSCGFTAFHHYYDGKLQGWTSPRYMPRIRTHYGNDPDRVPFDFYEVLGALAPRPVFINAPVSDSNFAVSGVRKVAAETRKLYQLLGHPEAPVYRYPECGHDFPPEIREECYRWLDTVLK